MTISPGAYRPVPLRYTRPTADEQHEALVAFQSRMRTRRTVRDFSPDPVPDELIDRAIAVAASAPSSANMQPWRFVGLVLLRSRLYASSA
jgi:hypothetical protein